MSNSIWKTPEENPRQEQLVAWVDRNGMHAGRFDTCYNCFCACASCFVDLRKVKRWCSLENLDDLIAQADKAERLQKAVDVAEDALKYARQRGLDNKATPFAIGTKADKALDEIKQLIK